MTTNFANSSPFMDPNYDWRIGINNTLTSQGLAPKYDLTTPKPTWQDNVAKAYGSVDASPFAAIRDLAIQHGTAPATTQPASGSTTTTGKNYTMTSTPYGPGGASGAGYGMGSNPYQGAQAEAMYKGAMSLFGQMNNQIRSDSVATGGLGGSRQGVAQGVGMGKAMDAYLGNVADLYGQNWQLDQQNALQSRGLDLTQRGQDITWQNNYNNTLDNRTLMNNNYNLGLRGQDITWQNNYNNTLDNREQMRNQFYLGNRGMDVTQQNNGMNFYSNLLNTATNGANGTPASSGFDWSKAFGGFTGGQQFWNNIFKD